MKYVAFLRAVNVGGKNLMSMAALKACLDQAELANVRTVIQSGNVIFESEEKSARALTKRIESTIAKTLGIESRVVLLTQAQLKAVVAGAPAAWKQPNDLRRNVAFLRPPRRRPSGTERSLRQTRRRHGACGKRRRVYGDGAERRGEERPAEDGRNARLPGDDDQDLRNVPEDPGADGSAHLMMGMVAFDQGAAECRCDWSGPRAARRAIIEDGTCINVR